MSCPCQGELSWSMRWDEGERSLSGVESAPSGARELLQVGAIISTQR